MLNQVRPIIIFFLIVLIQGSLGGKELYIDPFLREWCGTIRRSKVAGKIAAITRRIFPVGINYYRR